MEGLRGVLFIGNFVRSGEWVFLFIGEVVIVGMYEF